MLQIQTVEPDTFSLLKRLSALPALSSFSLAGGTALSLQIGHRISVDLDFFGEFNGSFDDIYDLLHVLGKLEDVGRSASILSVKIDNVKIDIVKYRYGTIRPIAEVDGIRLHSLPDIAAMKLAAIAGRGKKRDFYDLAFLLRQHPLKEMISFYNEKYPDGSEFMILKSLLYFEDARVDESPKLLKPLDWEDVVSLVTEEVRLYNQLTST